MRMNRFIRMLVVSLAAWVSATGSAQEAYLDFVVTEADFEALLGEMEMTGETLIEARALWGRQWFDLREAKKAYESFKTWQNMTTPLALDFFRAGPQFLSEDCPWSWKEFIKQFSYGQREIFESFFHDLESVAPNGRNQIAEAQSRLRRSAISGRQKPSAVYGAWVDLYQVILDLDRRHPSMSFAETDWPDAIRDIFMEYEPTFYELMSELDRASLIGQFKENNRTRPAEEVEKTDWVAWYVEQNSGSSVIASRIRSLNQETADQITESLPEEARERFTERAERLISPFAYRKPAWTFWLEAALKQRNIDEELQTALVDLEQRLSREQSTRNAEFVAAYDLRSRPDQLRLAQQVWEESMVGLRAFDDDKTDSQVAYDQALQDFKAFDEQCVERIRSLIGESGEVLSGPVLTRIEAEGHEISRMQSPSGTKERLQEERVQTRQDSPFITAREFRMCVQAIAFADDERQSIFESLYGDFRDHFDEEKRHFQQQRLIAEEQAKVDHANATNPIPGGPGYSATFMIEWSRRWIDLRMRLEREFEEQVRLFLDETEQEAWSREVRHLRRVRMIPWIRDHQQMGKKRFVYDLIAVAREAVVESKTDDNWIELLRNCEMDTDFACRDFENRDMTLFGEMLAVIEQLRENDNEQLRKKRLQLETDIKRMRGELNKVHDKYLTFLGDALNEPVRSKFLNAIDRAEYPWLFRISPPEMVIAAVRRDQAFEADRGILLDTFESNYTRALDELRRDFLRLARNLAHETDPEKRPKLFGPLYDLMHRRNTLARDACVEIRKLIDDDEFDDLAFDIRLLLSSYN